MAIIIFILLLLPDAYIWYNFMRNIHWAWALLMVAPTLLGIALMITVQTPWYQDWMFRVAMTLIVLCVIPKLLFMIISLMGGMINIVAQIAMHKTPLLTLSTPLCRGFHAFAIALCTLASGIIIYGLGWGWKKITIHEETLAFNELPQAFEGYRIVQLSDLHMGTYRDAPEAVDEIVRLVNEQHPDLIVFTGDIVNSTPEELDMFMDVMPRLKARDGIYSIMGNHDYCKYRHYDNPRQQVETIKELQRRERSWGWNLLLNENRIIHHGGDSIALIGVENSSKPPFPDYCDMNKALKGLPDGIFKILLSHDPTHWRRAVLPETDIHLQLSGHTHATQFRIFGWSPASFAYDEWGGRYEDYDHQRRTMTKNDDDNSANDSQTSATTGATQRKPTPRQLFVSTGSGGNFAFRFGVWPEIVVLTLKR